MATKHETSQASKCNTPSPTSSDSFSDYGSARRLTRKADRVNITKHEDNEDGDENDFRLDLDFDRRDDEYDSILDLDFERVDQHDTHVIIEGEPMTPRYAHDIHELDNGLDTHDDHNDKQALAPTSANISEVGKALDEWGFDESILLGSIERDMIVVPPSILIVPSDSSSNDESDEDGAHVSKDGAHVSNYVSEESSDAPSLESSQELNESNFVHSQVPNFAPSNAKRISKPPCDRFVTYTIESMDDDDDENDDEHEHDASDDDDDDHDNDDEHDDEHDDDYDDANDDDDEHDDELVVHTSDDDDDDDGDDDEDKEDIESNKCRKRKRV